MSKEFDKFLDSVENITKTVPELYEDLLQPAIRETGKVLAIIPQTINAKLAPIRQKNAYSEFKVTETTALLAEQLKNADASKIITPDNKVAIPLLKELYGNVDSEILKEIFTKLLSKAMYEDTASTIHPVMVDIVIKLSPIDARILSALSKENPNKTLHECMNDKECPISIKQAAYSLSILSQLNLVHQGPEYSHIFDMPFDSWIDKALEIIREKPGVDQMNKLNNRMIIIYTTTAILPPFIALSHLGEELKHLCITPIES